MFYFKACLNIGVIVKSIFAKITDAKRFFCFLMIKTLQLKGKVPGITTKVCAALLVLLLWLLLQLVLMLLKLRKLLWLSQGLFLSAGVFFIIKKHKNRLASVIFAKTDLTIIPMYRDLLDVHFTSWLAVSNQASNQPVTR